MFKAIAIRIVDGDTFEMDKTYGEDIKIVRIADLDTPEKGDPGYEEAKKKLSDLIYNKEVEIEQKAIDKYKRLVADVFLNGKSVADLMKQN